MQHEPLTGSLTENHDASDRSTTLTAPLAIAA